MIEIMNLSNEIPSYLWDYKVDRSTPVGNPFPMLFERMRDNVCDRYKTWFDAEINSDNSAFKKYLETLIEVYKRYGQLRLFCWCAPRRCHAETIRDHIYRYCTEVS